METNKNRIVRDIEALSQFTSTPGFGVTRFTYSHEDGLARAYLTRELESLGLAIHVDGAGNMRARLMGSKPEGSVILTGSHIDTVRNGGKFDGIVGVVGALEAIRTLKETGFVNQHPIELVIFAEEEGSNFGSTLAGSKTMVGKYSAEDLKKLRSADGRSMFEMARDAGFDPDSLPRGAFDNQTIKAMLELHIEQSVVHDNAKKSIGVISAIAGMKALRIVLRGTANHAGATPMDMRSDPMVAAAEVILLVEKLVKRIGPSVVGTIGKIGCVPNVSNVIPGEVSVSVDIRDIQQENIDLVLNELEQQVQEVASRRKVACEFVVLGGSKPIQLSQGVVSIIEHAAMRRGYDYMKMTSGAVHDACMFGNLTQVGMIFVPSIAGRSHVPEELTSYDDIKKGCDVLLDALVELSGGCESSPCM